MRISDPTWDDVRAVAEQMRPADVAEFTALANAETHEELTAQILETYRSSDTAICAYADGPVAVGAILQPRPNVAIITMFATPEFPSVALGLTRFLRNSLLPKVKAAGVHRIECASLAGSTDAHRWIEMLGLKREAELRGFGRAGETFIQFSWVDDAYDRPTGA